MTINTFLVSFHHLGAGFISSALLIKKKKEKKFASNFCIFFRVEVGGTRLITTCVCVLIDSSLFFKLKF